MKGLITAADVFSKFLLLKERSNPEDDNSTYDSRNQLSQETAPR